MCMKAHAYFVLHALLCVYVQETWPLAYGVCSAYYEGNSRKIRDLNYLESARKKGEGRAGVG